MAASVASNIVIAYKTLVKYFCINIVYLFLIAKFAIFSGTDRFKNVSTGISSIEDVKITVSEFAHGVVVARKSHESYRGSTGPG